jgi:hypothetical protein
LVRKLDAKTLRLFTKQLHEMGYSAPTYASVLRACRDPSRQALIFFSRFVRFVPLLPKQRPKLNRYKFKLHIFERNVAAG